MQSFFVLGLIPGTHIQITFLGWLYIVTVVANIVAVLRFARYRHAVRAYLACRRIAHLIDRYQLAA